MPVLTERTNISQAKKRQFACKFYILRRILPRKKGKKKGKDKQEMKKYVTIIEEKL
jgi:hypothetical protein